MDMGLHLAFGGEGQRLGEVLAAADDGAAQGDALEYDIEDRRGEVTGRQADQTDRALAPPQAERLGEGDRRDRGYQHAMGAAPGGLDSSGRSVRRARSEGGRAGKGG